MAFTFFFRDSHTLEQAIKFFLPNISGFQKIKIWDAGCAMGQEPYTFAILLAEKMGYFAFKNVEIDATDIDETNTFEKIVTDGIYPEQELSRIPPEIFQKYFNKIESPGMCKIDDNIRNRVKFYKNDLLQFKPVNTNYNLIICKNVLLHFQPNERIEVMRLFHSVLASKGILITEQTQAMPDDILHLFERVAPDANVYQKI